MQDSDTDEQAQASSQARSRNGLEMQYSSQGALQRKMKKPSCKQDAKMPQMRVLVLFD